MKKEVKGIYLELNKHTISNLTNGELNSVKGGTQLGGVQSEKHTCHSSPPPRPAGSSAPGTSRARRPLRRTRSDHVIYLDTSFNNHVVSLSINKRVSLFDFGITTSWSNLNNKNQYQLGGLFTWYPKGNLNLYTTTSSISAWEDEENRVVLDQLVGGKVAQKYNYLYLHDKNLLELPGMVSALSFCRLMHCNNGCIAIDELNFF